MSTITHVFHSHQRVENGIVTSTDRVPRRAFLEYDITGTQVIISINPTLTPKKAFLQRQDGFTLYYRGEDPIFRFVVECWPDNGTIEQLSVFRDDRNLEIRYISHHQDRM